MNYHYLDDDIKSRKQRVRSVVIWGVEIVLVILLAYLVIAFGVEKTTMIGDSMSTTLEDENKIIVNKMIYRFTDPKRFDIIVFKQAGKEHGYYIVKRIIGLPGEKVQVKDGQVFIDDEPLEEKNLVEPCVNGGIAEEAVILDENEYFVMGDNRNNSEDSRFANIGNVIKDDIIGKAWLRLHPFDFIHMVNIKKEAKTTNDLEEE